MSAWDVTFGATSPSVCSLAKDRLPPRLCENHFVVYLCARLIQAILLARIKDLLRLQPRFFCCVLTSASGVFTQPPPDPAVRTGRP
jgi:hypothetical protein